MLFHYLQTYKKRVLYVICKSSKKRIAQKIFSHIYETEFLRLIMTHKTHVNQELLFYWNP